MLTLTLKSDSNTNPNLTYPTNFYNHLLVLYISVAAILSESWNTDPQFLSIGGPHVHGQPPPPLFTADFLHGL